MRIEHSVVIKGDMNTVWSVFTDLTCWTDWSSVFSDVSSEHPSLTEGKRFKFCIRPFVYPISIQPVVEEVVPGRRIVWSGSKHGVSARHTFTFWEEEDSVRLTSEETFTCGFFRSLLFRFPRRRLHKLSRLMLEELKHAVENGAQAFTPEEGVIWEKKSGSE